MDRKRYQVNDEVVVMEMPSDQRLLAMCLFSSAVGFASWRVFLSHLNGGVILLVAIAILAVLMFVDGYVDL